MLACVGYSMLWMNNWQVQRFRALDSHRTTIKTSELARQKHSLLSKYQFTIFVNKIIRSTLTLYVATIGMDVIQYRSKVSWHSKLEPRDSNLEPWCSKRSRIESRGSRNKALSDMQKLERVSRKWFISRSIRPYDSGLNVIFFGDNLCSELNVDLHSTMETYR